MLLVAASLSSPLFADPIFVIPPDVAPGGTYRLVVVTGVTYDAEDHNIADYNNAVNTELNDVAALGALGTTWSVIGSSVPDPAFDASGVNAIDNIGQDAGIPIYNLDGELVASDATTNSGGLFSGEIENLIDIDENGNTVSGAVWTGSADDGTEAPGAEPGQYEPEYGIAGATDSTWITEDLCSGASCDGVAYYGDFSPFYAISGILTAPTPEPGAVSLLVAGLSLLALRIVMRRARET